MLAKDLEPYLKTLYRYPLDTPCAAKARLDKMDGLMVLQHQLHQGLEGWSEGQKGHLDRLLEVETSKERIPRMSRHILNVLHFEAKLPLLEMFDLADEGLEVFEKLLLQDYNL